MKKKRYESDEYEDDNDDVSPDRCNGSGLQIDEYPDSTVSDEHEQEFASHSEDYRENTQSPAPVEESKSGSKHKKHHKSDKQHRSHEKDSEKKVNGHSSSSSSKKSSHRDKETKRVEEKSSRSEKASPSKKSDSKDSKSKHSSSSSSKSSEKLSSPSKVKKEILIQDDNGIDSGSGASFAEALGMIVPTKGNGSKTTYKKKTVYSAPASPTPSTSSSKSSRTAKSNTLSPLVQVSMISVFYFRKQIKSLHCLLLIKNGGVNFILWLKLSTTSELKNIFPRNFLWLYFFVFFFVSWYWMIFLLVFYCFADFAS